MSDYQSFPVRTVNIGINIRNSPDKVDEGSWVKLRNLRSTQEGQIQPREGFDLDTTTGVASGVHTISRLDDTTKLIGVGGQLFRNGTAYPTAGYSGNPLSVNAWRPTISSDAWAYVADENQMRKVHPDGTDYKWGITGPTTGLTFVDGGAGNLNSSVSGGTVYDWRATYYSSATGAESNPSPVVTGLALANRQASINVDASADAQVDQVRLYRRGGTLLDWTLSVTTPNLAGAVIDNNADSTIAANEILDLEKDVPFTSLDAAGGPTYEVPLPYVWGPFIGKYFLACGAPNEPGYVFWTNPQDPDSTTAANKVEVTPPKEPLLGGMVYSGTSFTFSRDNFYVLNFGSATDVTFNPQKTPVGRGVSAPFAFCVAKYIYFLGNDGIYQTDGQSPAESITEEHLRPIFNGVNGIGSFRAIDYTQTNRLRMAYNRNEVWFHYVDIGGDSRILVYNTLYQRWRSVDSNLTNFWTSYADENQPSSKYYMGAANGNTYIINADSTNGDAGLSQTVEARTGSFDQGAPTTFKEYGNVIIDCNPNGNTLTVTPYVNTELTALPSFTLTGTSRQKFVRSLGDTRAYNIAFDFAWGTSRTNGILYQLDVMWRMEEEAIRHWQFITTHGMSGWQHVRDMYISLISNDTVTLTVNVDGVDQPTYAIASTGGLQLKRYVQLAPNKGKIFKYTLDCPSDFRLFGNECAVRAKSWNTNLGYALVAPFQSQQVEA
jgi:hypothetical protein